MRACKCLLIILLASVSAGAAEVDLNQTGESLSDYIIEWTTDFTINGQGTYKASSRSEGFGVVDLYFYQGVPIQDFGGWCILNFRIANISPRNLTVTHVEVNDLFGDIFQQLKALCEIPFIQWPQEGYNWGFDVHLEGVNSNGAWSWDENTYMDTERNIYIDHQDPIVPPGIQTWIDFDSGEWLEFSVSFKRDLDGDGFDDIESINFDTNRVFIQSVLGVQDIDNIAEVNAVGYAITIPRTSNTGTPLSWLRENGITNNYDAAVLLDADSDGYTTAQEYICNTCPTNALSHLDLATHPSGLEFSTAINRLYAVQSSSTLTSNAWKTVTNNIPGSGTPISLLLNSTESNAFFRVRVSLPDE